MIHTAKKPEPEIPERVEVPDYAHLLPRTDSQVHPVDPGRRSLVLYSRRRSRWFPSSPGQRICERFSPKSRSMAECRDKCELDVRGDLCAPVRRAWRSNRQFTWLYVRIGEYRVNGSSRVKILQRRHHPMTPFHRILRLLAPALATLLVPTAGWCAT